MRSDVMGGSSSPVLVTGGAGFIGSHLVRTILADGRTVRVMELPDAAVDHLPTRGVEIVRGDIRRPAAVRDAMRGCGEVLHLAANPNLWARNPGEFDAINHIGTQNVLAAARALNARRIVHVSTESILTTRQNGNGQIVDEDATTELRNMVGAYCRSKFRAEEAARDAAAHGMPVVIAAPTVPVGPGDHRRGPLSRLICQFANGRIKGYVDGQINLIDVRDAAAGIWAAARSQGVAGRRYLLAGENWTICELFQALASLTGQPAPMLHVPYALALSFAWAEEQWSRFTGRTPVATTTGVRLTRHSFRFDGTRSAAELNLSMRPCLAALRDAVRYFHAEGRIETLDEALLQMN